MVKVDSICPNCGELISIDDGKDANICPKCNEAFVTEKAINFLKEGENKDGQLKSSKKETS